MAGDSKIEQSSCHRNDILSAWRRQNHRTVVKLVGVGRKVIAEPIAVKVRRPISVDFVVVHLDPEFCGVQRLVAARHLGIGAPTTATTAL